MAMGCNPKGNRAQTEYKDGCFTAMNLYNLKIYNQTGCVASYEAKRNVGALKDLTGHNDGNVKAEDWTNEYIQLDGKDDWINLGQMSFRTNQITLDLTMMILSTPSKNTTLIGNLETSGVALGITPELKPTMQINIDEKTSYKAVSSTAIELNKKVHVMGVYDGANVMIFVNGQLTGKMAYTGTIKAPNNATVMSIGSNPSGSSAGIEFTNMRVYTAHIYNKAYWDVSANGDNSILAWSVNSNSSGAKKVYIASKGNIYANANASYMFSNIGAASICTATTALTNLNLLKTANTTNMYSMFWKTGYNAMTSLDLGTSFSTAKATNLEYMFQECGYKAMTSLNLRGINTSTATSMYAMFDGTGYTAMTSLNLGANFSTANVTKMTRMFKNCGYTKMTTLTLGSKFNTAKVTEMISMFEGTGYKVMTSLNLEGSFDTSKVTNMQAMFKNCGYTAMTTLTLGSKFNTAKVTNMQEMFANTGYTKMTKLDLGDIFYTTVATNMTSMFNATGYIAMGELDLGPAFTKIAGTYSNVFTNTGKSGCIIHAAEAIYQNSTTFKLNTSSGTQVGYSRGTIDPRYRVEWIIEPNSVSVDKTNKKMTIGLRARTNNNATSYYKSNITGSLGTGNITVYIDGEAATSISKSLSGPTSVKNGTTGYNDVKYTLTLTGFEQGSRKSGKKYKEWSGNVQLSIAQGTATDSYGNKNMAVNNDGSRANNWLDTATRADFIKPEFTYVYSSGNINHTNKTLTVDFTVADRYFSSSTLTSNAANVTVKLLDKDINISGLTKTITKLSDYTDGSRGKVGENYRLTIGNIQRTTETDGLRDYSGPMSITFPANMVKDTSGNVNDAKTITIGVNDPGTGSQQVVDVVSPVWSVASTDVNGATVKIRVKDKYLVKTGGDKSKLTLALDKIAVLVNGTESTQVTKTITSGPTLIASGSNGYDTTYEYTIKLGNIAQTTKNYIEFTPKETIVGGKAKYRDENGGSITLRIKAGAVQDAFTNTNAQQDLYIGNVDNTGPEVYDIQKTIAANGDETFVFNITDKNYDSSKIVSLSELNITIDGAQFSSAVQKSLTSQTLTDSATNKVLGHQYTLKLTNVKESTSSFASAVTATTNRRVYREYSGTIRIVISASAARDKKGNTLNTSTTTITSFNDKLAPEVVYIWSNSVINKSAKTFTMIFDITDKYYSSASLAIGDLTIKIGGKTPNWNAEGVGHSLSISDIPGAAGKGKRYTLTLSNLQKLQIKSGDKYLDYSGVVTVAIPANKVKDTSGQGNVATTLTSGITIPGGSGSEQIVDVVEPYVQKMSSTVNVVAKTASIKVRISDRYFSTSTLTKDTIKVYINGTENASVKTGWSTSEETETRTEKGTTSTVHVATNYTLNMSGFASNINQIKVVVPAGVVTDTSGNKNKQAEYIIYNVLKSTASETGESSGFLGKAGLPRKNIDSVTFVSSTASKNSTAWDASAQGDNSILGWYTTNSNGSYKVYVGSNYEMHANIDSKYLFSNIGYSSLCTSTTTISGLELLNTEHVTNMYSMFWRTGYNAMANLNLGNNFKTSSANDLEFMFMETGYKNMTTLTLGSNFNTSKATKMYAMFDGTGYTKMTSLNLGGNFDTTNVKKMTRMFRNCGYTKMTTLTLGSKFNTGNVEEMISMFEGTGHELMTGLNLGSLFNTAKVKTMKDMFKNCGYAKMTSLNLGSNFNTSIATDMSGMFSGCGYTAMTTLTLGSKFNTAKVTTMKEMFLNTGHNVMDSLDLGDQFYTTAATDMTSMFNGTGATAMTSLDLGPAFTKIAGTYTDMFTNTGKSGSVVIYATESIFQTKNSFKVTIKKPIEYINYTRGTINARYRTEWIKESVTVDEANKKVMITLRGRTNPDAGTAYVSNLTSSLAAGNIRVYINGTELTNIGKSLGTATTVQNATTKANDVRQVLTLTNIEQGRVTGKEYKEYSGNISLEIAQGNLADKYGNKNMAVTSAGARANNTVADTTVQKNTSNTMFADFTKPEFTYVYADSDINHTNKTLTAIFKVADKYRASTAFTKKSDGTYDASPITVGIDSYDKTALNNAISKKLTLESERTEEISGQNRVTVQTYKLVIGNLEQKGQGGLSNGYTYSGILTLGFPEGTITDTSGHKSPATTITIGKNEPGGTGTGKPVDVVDPVWSVASANADTGVIKLRVKDKYLTKATSKFNLAKESIKIIVNGVESTAIVKTLDGPTTITDGQEYEYTLTLSNIAPSGGGYTEFTPIETIVGGKAKYRNDNGGSITIRIPSGAVTDANGNKTKQQDLNVGNMDLTEPEVYFVQKNRDLANNQETIIFNVTDKNYDSTKLIAANELTTWVDGTQMDSKLTKSISSKTISTKIDGSTRVVGHQYTLVLKGFAESDSAFASSGRVYREYSGNLQVKINKNAARDKRGNTLNSSTTTITQFTDVVRPDIKCKWSDAVINKNNKTFTLIFDVTDKYYSSSTLTFDDLTIKIGGKTPNWSTNDVGHSLSVSDIPNASGKGKRYTLTLSNLQKLQIKSGDKYLDYSGVVTVAIPAGKVKDTTGNTNLAKTITSGITIPGGSGSEQVVDVVEPYVQKMSSTVNAVAKTASIKVRISDRYFSTSILTKDTIKVYINGTENTAVKTGWVEEEEPPETRTESGKTSTVHVATNYTLNISGFASNINQIKVVVPAGVVTDTSGNKNKQAEYIIYNVLKSTASETGESSGFLGKTGLPRKNIDSVTFVSSTTSKNSTAWDASAQGDSSILGWYTTNSNGSYKVYIGSNYDMHANIDSKYLFSNIGYSSLCTSTTTISGLELLNTEHVTNMYSMFWRTGYNAMASLNLGNNFKTSSANDLEFMFMETGYKNMTTLTLGSNFNTSKATKMYAMFDATGYTKMTSLNLGGNFDTTNVKKMTRMFRNCGYTKMTTLTLGSKFNTAKVTDMESMFHGCGYKEMTSLDLGNLFDTSKVTTMKNMFNQCGHELMATLNLGSKFNTANVTTMENMFNQAGRYKLTSLNLGSQFDTSKVTNMANMFNWMQALNSLSLGTNFDTSNVTTMAGMFWGTGYSNMTSFNLGSKFNTKKVTNMNSMFYDFAGTKLTSLDLGDQFYTTNVTDMTKMFYQAGITSMTLIDLGPAFTKIAGTYTDMFTNTGKSGACVIYAPESIYQDKNNFKLNTSSGTKINYTRGTINARYRTEWIKESVTVDEANKKVMITLRGRTNPDAGTAYVSNLTSSLAAGNIRVYINGTEITNIGKSLGTATTVQNATTKANDVRQVLTLTNFEQGRLNGKLYKEYSGNISLEIAQGNLTDKYGNKNMAVTSAGARTGNTVADGTVQKNTPNTMFADMTKPEYTYIYSSGNINHINKTLTIDFTIADRYFSSTTWKKADGTYDASGIIIKLKDTSVTIPAGNITKTLTKLSDYNETRNGSTIKVGENYRLVIGGLEQKTETGGFRDYSGPMDIIFPAGNVTDTSGNQTVQTTVTIGVNEPDKSGSQQVVDVVDPVWSVASSNTETGEIKLRIKDKYLTQNNDLRKLTLKKENIKVIVNGVESTAIVKSLTGPTQITANKEYEYKLVLSNIVPAEGGYTNVTPTEPIVGGTAKYKNENGGNINFRITAGTAVDLYGNTSKQQDFSVGNMDLTEPEVYFVQKNRDLTNKKETIIFNVTDKNYDETKLISASEIITKIDGTTVADSKKTISSIPIKAIVDGSERIIGHQYTLVLADFVESDATFKSSTRTYRELSGELELKINKTASRDKKGNEINESTTTIRQTTDVVRPEVKYTYATSNIDKTNGKFKMVFDVVDKYSTEAKLSALTLNDLTIKVGGEVPDWNKVGRNLTHTNISENVTVTQSGVSKTVNKVVGVRYTLELTKLEQSAIATNKKYLDYSGVITVAIPANKITDTIGNGNIGKTLTSGVSLKGTTSGSSQIVDVVKPIWEVKNVNINHSTKQVTMEIYGTDKYYASTSLTLNDISVNVDGENATSITKSFKTNDPEKLTETRDGKTVQYGVKYTLTLSGWEQTSLQNGKAFKEWSGNTSITIAAGKLSDSSGNTNISKTVSLGLVDFIKPVIQKVSSTKGTNDETIVFNVYDKYLNSTLSADKISVLVDNEVVPTGQITRTLTKVSDIKATVNGTANHIVGHQYKLVLTGFEQKRTSINRSREYSDWSGTVSIKIAKDAMKDTSNNTNDETTIRGDFIDVIKPNITYEHLDANIDKNGKKYTIVFDITDKYYDASKSTKLTINDLTIKVDGENPTNATKTLSNPVEIKNTVSYTKNGTVVREEKVVGVRYTLVISNLQQSSVNTSKNYKDYSGVVTVAIPANKVKDTTSNANIAKTITSGINQMGETTTGSQKIVDVVDPYWQVSNVNIDHSKSQVTMTIKGTDKYYKGSSLNKDNITVLVDGEAATSVTKTLSAATSITNGVQYTLTLTTWQQSSKQSGKSYLEWSGNTVIRIAAGTMTDTNGNSSKQQDFSIGLVDFIKPVIEKVSATKGTNTETIVFTVNDKYINSTLTTSKINVLVDGENANEISKGLKVEDIKATVNGTSKTVGHKYTLVLSNFEKTRASGKKYKNWSGTVTLQIPAGSVKDTSNNTNNATTIQGDFVDFIKPEYTYVYSSGNIDKTNKTLTVDFTIADRYFSSTTWKKADGTYDASGISINLLDTNAQIPNANITKTLTRTSEIKETINGKSVTVGENYRLVIGGLEQRNANGLSDGTTYSGPMSISFPKEIVKDTSNNQTLATVFTIGVNEPDKTGSQQIVDVVDPIWKAENININHTNKQVTVTLSGTDKYYKSNSLAIGSIKVIVDGQEATSITKTLSTPTAITETRDGKKVQTGVKYILTLSNWEETTKQTDKSKQFFEWSGTTKIEIAKGTITDESGNTNKKQTFTLGNVDFIKPKIEKVSSSKGTDANGKGTETIIFNVIDKYLDTTDLVTTDEISVYIDGELVPTSPTTQITRTLTKESNITATVNNTSKVVGHQYKLVLSNFEQKRTAINYNREYSDWSGNVKIKIAEGAVKDTNKPTPNKNAETYIDGDFVDFIKPNATYQYSESNIDYNGKTFTMVFDITDKFYASGNLNVNDLTVTIDGNVPNSSVGKSLTIEDRENTIHVTENGTTKTVKKVIGKRYTLTLSNLEQLQTKDATGNYIAYSGVITVAIPKDKLVDSSTNKNNYIVLTSGITIPGGTGNEKIVDVVDPLIERLSSSADPVNKTATIKFKVTDKYFASSTITKDNIKILVNNVETSGITRTLTSTALNEQRTVNGTTTNVQYGIEYTLIISGYDPTANQVKIRIPQGYVKDKSGNGNKQTDLMVYSVLRKTDTETSATSAFLGNTAIQRQNIDNITFVNSTSSKNSTAWDVSAQQDNSIIAWYTKNSNGSFKVYIGSNYEIFANTNSTNLFHYVGESTLCTSAETITNLNLLNVSGVTNMKFMFRHTGMNAMTKLDLGDNFDTSNVIYMGAMFGETGYKAMKTLNLGNKFNTSKVVEMEWMFANTGHDVMTKLDLGSNFDTSNVTSMFNMFRETGYAAMTSLNLGSKFNTSKVTDMSYMFGKTGYMKLTALNLGSLFNTSKVTDMSGMFEGTGYTAMTSLNLGANFDTSKVTNMSNMFNSTGYAKMASLDLKAKFNTSKVTNMSGMFASTGHELMTTLDLGANFNTSAVTDMSSMFEATGYKKMTKLNLREKFNTSKVTNMSKMFKNAGFTAMTSLDLGNTFYTTVATDTSEMFNNTGATAMTILDLGPAFDRIPDTNTDMFKNTGTAALVVYAPESIYSNVTTFIANRTRN